MNRVRPTAICLLVVALSGCAGPGPKPDYHPVIAASDFVAGVDNPFLPYPQGAWWTYDSGKEHIEVRVLNESRMIMGVQATVVRDTVTVQGVVTEDTYDWFAQDKAGNVWYLGEDTKEYHGSKVSTAGGWEWGVDGALAGILMWAHPVANQTAYFQEFLWPQAADEGAVIALGQSVVTPAGSFNDTVTTHEWSRLEKGSCEHAYYARGVGAIDKRPCAGGPSETLIAYNVPASA
jgi:hypothetical protein